MRASPKVLTRLATSLAVIAAVALAGAGVADAASFTVDSTVDAPLANPSGTTCVSTHESACTLRAAVQAAGNNSGASTINVPAGSYDLESATGPEIVEPETGDLDVKIETSLTITGAGAGATTIGATVATRLIRVHYGASLTLAGVSLVGGKSEAGGAILNEGALTIRRSALTENSTEGFGGAIDSSTSATATTIEGSTVKKNVASDGGAIRADGGTVSLIGDRMLDNTAEAFGGVLDEEQAEPAAVVIERSTLSGNKAALNGGALAMEPGETRNRTGHLTVLDSTFDEDTSIEGGAIFESYDDEEINITRSTFEKDEATAGNGGAIYEDETPVDHVAESTFEHDESTEFGGAIDSADGEIDVTRSTFADNRAGAGGALLLNDYMGSEPIVTGSTFTGNYATTGGAIDRQAGGLHLSASTLVENSAALGGGGVYYEGEEPTLLVNDTLEGNSVAPEGAALYLKPGIEPYVTLLNDTIAHNTSEAASGIANAQAVASVTDTIVAFNTGGDCLSSTSEEADHGGNIDGDGTCFHRPPTGNHTEVEEEELKLGSLGDHGGFTETMSLEAGSLAIEDGIATCAPTDERGVARPSEKCDSGAFQRGNYTAPPLASVEGGAVEPDSTSATVTAKVNPNGLEVTSCEIEYGLEGAYEYSVPCSPGPGSGNAAVTVEGSLGELMAGQKYQYRVVVIDANGVADGPLLRFDTSSETTTTTTTTSSAAPTTTATTTTTTTTSTTASKPAETLPCVSRRAETIVWRVPAGAHLGRILVTLDGKRYRTLRAGARSLRVSFAGLPKRTVVVRITGIGTGGSRYKHAFTFHTCQPHRRGTVSPGVPYLRAS